MRKIRIVGVGHCCQDNLCTVEAYPPEDGSTHILAIDDSQGGGAVATAMVAAARLGAEAAFISNLGTDETGTHILEGFQRENVDIRGIERLPGYRSSTSYVMVDPEKGTRTKFPYRDNLPSIEWTQEKKQMIADADALHLDGTQWENAMAAADIACAAGTVISLDGCSRQADNAKNLALSDRADILIMNAVYPFRVSGKKTAEEALSFFASRRPRTVLAMTLGDKGCLYYQDGQVHAIPAFFVKAVDTTGAGDVFHGAFLARYLETGQLEASLRFASAVSALKCEKPGGREGIPTRAQAEAFLRTKV